MADWKAVLMVPVEIDIEYARDITTAMRGALKALEEYKPVRLKGVNGDVLKAKLMAIDGPPDQIAEWASRRREELALAGPPIGGGDGGPSAA